jgi:tetratricopeptide (TPR) repeat protein
MDGLSDPIRGGCGRIMAILWFTVAAISRAQDAQPDPHCQDLNQSVLELLRNGDVSGAEKALSPALSRNTPEGYTCGGMVLNNMAGLTGNAGRYAHGERYAARSIAALEKVFPPNSPVLLNPLHSLASARFNQGNTAGARQVLKRMRAIPMDRAQDRAFVHGLDAYVSLSEHDWPKAELEYLAAASEWESAGQGNSANAGGVFLALSNLYIIKERYSDAVRALDRARDILANAPDAGRMDQVLLLATRGVLHARQREWAEAEQDLRSGLSLADRPPAAEGEPVLQLLSTYAEVLIKNHHRKEAGKIQERAAVLRRGRAAGSVVDVNDLMAKKTPR